MKKVLLLGAGLVTKPLVKYLLDKSYCEMVIATRTVSKAMKLLDNHPRGKALTLDVSNEQQLEDLIRDCDLAISLVPYAYHPTVARLCIKHKKHCITTSYVQPVMNALDGDAKDAGVLILNEIGLDPGIDHMSAMRVIHDVVGKGGKITSFRSYCGGFPAPDANNNPLGYKFSWSPMGVLMAGKNSGRFLEDGKEVSIPGPDLFAHYNPIQIEDVGEFEAYTNRDCLGYIELYGLKDAKTMFRGTLRYRTWCDTMKKVVDLGLLSDEERDLTGLTYNQWMATFAPAGAGPDGKKAVMAHLGLAEDSHTIKKLEWLGLFSDNPLPLEKGSPIEIMTETMVSKMAYQEGERDMIVLYHDFLAEDSGENRPRRITSTLVDYGIPNGDSSMSRTVSLPAAIAADLILTENIRMTGVHIPVMPEVYEPVLNALEKVNIVCREKTYPIS